MAEDNKMKDMAELDQATAVLGDTLPPLWRRMYLRLQELGFADDEAMLLVRTFIASNAPNGVHL